MELRSRGDPKVVWRSSRHLVCSSQLSRGKARYPREEEFSWLSGYRGVQGKARWGSGGSQRASKEEIVTVVLSMKQRPRPESRVPPHPTPDLQPAQVRIAEPGRNRGLSGARAQQPHPPQPRITHQRLLPSLPRVRHWVPALRGKEAPGEELACPLALELPGKEGRAEEASGKREPQRRARSPGQPAEAGPGASPEKTSPEGRAERGRAVVWLSPPNRRRPPARPTHTPASAR